MLKLLKTIAVLTLLLGAPPTFAQAIDPVQFTITPETPGPNERVTIQVDGIGSFLGDSNITWQQDGKTVLTGKGERAFSFTTGGLGVQTRIHVVIVSSEKGTITRDFSFIPSAVNLLWEADTSVPPFYRGKALYSAGSMLKVIALPSVVAKGSTISSNNLSFQWSRNGSPVPAQSGVGRNILTFKGDQLKKSEAVSVDVYLGGVKVGRGAIAVPTVTPVVLFYSRDPLRGVLYDNALPSAISLTSNEITLQAVPYFFARESLVGSIAYSWKLGGKQTTGPDASRGILTLRQSGGGAGQAVLATEVQNTSPSQLIQKASAVVKIVFGAQSTNSSSLFGL